MFAISTRLQVGEWSEGRPVYKKVVGEQRYLLVEEGTSVWSVTESPNEAEALIQSGRATNSPSSEATDWDQDITVTCV